MPLGVLIPITALGITILFLVIKLRLQVFLSLLIVSPGRSWFPGCSSLVSLSELPFNTPSNFIDQYPYERQLFHWS